MNWDVCFESNWNSAWIGANSSSRKTVFGASQVPDWFDGENKSLRPEKKAARCLPMKPEWQETLWQPETALGIDVVCRATSQEYLWCEVESEFADIEPALIGRLSWPRWRLAPGVVGNPPDFSWTALSEETWPGCNPLRRSFGQGSSRRPANQ